MDPATASILEEVNTSTKQDQHPHFEIIVFWNSKGKDPFDSKFPNSLIKFF